MKILFVLISLCSTAFGQIKLTGIVRDKISKEPIEYANIGIKEKAIGTVCNSSGQFELLIPDNLKNNTLSISHLGYKEFALILSKEKNLSGKLEIYLEPIAFELKELTISAQKEITMGYKPSGNSVKGYFQATGLGGEGGTLIRNKDSIVLTSFNLNILKLTFDSLKFRLNFYDVRNRKPLTKINKKDHLFILSQRDTGIYTVALDDEQINISNDFICTIELIEIFGQNNKNAEFLFSAKPDNEGLTYRRMISYGKWEKFKKYSICFWLKGRQ